MSEIDDMTASVLAHWHRADPARKRAFCQLLRRVAEKDMTVTEAAEQYWVELGLSEADARRVVDVVMKQPSGRWREMLD